MFTQLQIDHLSANENVNKCTSKYIIYRPEFKLAAVKKYFNEGHSPRMIFREAGFDLKILGVERADDSLLRWRRIYQSRGAKGLRERQKVKPKIKIKDKQFKNDKERIKYLEAKIAYMDAENDFLAKLRGIKRE